MPFLWWMLFQSIDFIDGDCDVPLEFFAHPKFSKKPFGSHFGSHNFVKKHPPFFAPGSKDQPNSLQLQKQSIVKPPLASSPLPPPPPPPKKGGSTSPQSSKTKNSADVFHVPYKAKPENIKGGRGSDQGMVQVWSLMQFLFFSIWIFVKKDNNCNHASGKKTHWYLPCILVIPGLVKC